MRYKSFLIIFTPFFINKNMCLLDTHRYYTFLIKIFIDSKLKPHKADSQSPHQTRRFQKQREILSQSKALSPATSGSSISELPHLMLWFSEVSFRPF